MRQTLDLDESGAQRIEAIYLTPEITHQRQDMLAALELRPGERVLDVGTGPGFLAEAMAQAVGAAGQVCGIDFSVPVLELARNRCRELPQVRFDGAEATRMPYPDDRFDAAIAAQVYEYIHDTQAALAELYRVLRPGGRALLVDTDWGSLLWQTDDPVLTARIMGVWCRNLSHPYLPRALAPALVRAGFALSRRQALTLYCPEYSNCNYAHSLIRAIAETVAGRGGISQQETEDWVRDLEGLGRRGEFFFSLNRYLFLVEKPRGKG
ncbi:MAG: methyltransferase domain-containing protein [Candidatus Competibacteraceae bacterium]|nr:methyltransferase domain-containing protein [Candidatus Competibacteraceae bacterium]